MNHSAESISTMHNWPSLAQYGSSLPLKGGNLFYYDTGAGKAKPSGAEKPTLILIHGLGDESDSWRHIIPLLTGAGFRVIAPDLPGFGRSNGTNPGDKMTHNSALVWKTKSCIKEHTLAILALMEKTGAANAENPAVIIGSSMGATITQSIAGKRPDLVRAIILIDGCFPLSGKSNPGILLMALPFIGRSWYRNFRKNHEGAWKSLYPYYRDLDSLNEEDKTFLRNRVIARVESDSQEKAYFSSLRSLISLVIFGEKKFNRAMKTYAGKILLLWGDADTIVPIEQSSRFRSLYPCAEVQIIPKAGHLPQQDAPQKTAEAIINFAVSEQQPL